MSEPYTVDVVVKQTTGTYQTAAVNGVKASCTAGEQQAAEAFGRKYWGAAFVGVEHVQAATQFKPSIWRVSADPKAYAWAWASGLIEIHDTLPVDKSDGSGAVAFASGPKRALEVVLGGVAREGMGASAGKLLVPGVPEAKNQRDGMTALLLWINRCRLRNGNAGMYGVVFGREGSAQ